MSPLLLDDPGEGPLLDEELLLLGNTLLRRELLLLGARLPLPPAMSQSPVITKNVLISTSKNTIVMKRLKENS